MKIIFVICLCLYSVHGYDDTIEAKEKGSAGVPSAEVMQQRITISFYDIRYLFWWESGKSLFCIDKATGESHRWNYTNSEVITRYFEELDGESFVFGIPVKDSYKKAIIGSDNHIRTLTANDAKTTFTVSSPVITFEDKGYFIHTAHCDKEGTLYILLNFRDFGHQEKGSIMYRIKNKEAKKVLEFKNKVCDFVFNKDYNKMYVTENGVNIVQYNYNMDDGSISDPTVVFNISNTEFRYKMKAIEIDNENNLWVTAGDCVMKIKNGKVAKIIEMPFSHVTAITFGGYKSKNLFVGSKRQCNERKIHAGSVTAISGLKTFGLPDDEVVW